MIPWENLRLWYGYPLKDGHWPDISKHLNDGALIGGGWVEDAIYFDGVDDYVDCGWHDSLDILTNLSIELLINPVLGNVGALAAARGGPENNKYYFRLNANGTLGFDRYLPVGGSCASTIQVTEKWCYVAMVLRDDDNTVDFYIDSVNEQIAYTEAYAGGTPTKLTIGACLVPGAMFFFKGEIALVRIYDIALTTTQIKESQEQCYRLI